MKESELRKYHRYLGISLALFLLLQGGSGLLISLGQLFHFHVHAHGTANTHYDESEREHIGEDSFAMQVEKQEESEDHGVLGLLHHKEHTFMNFYRVVVGTSLMLMIFSGMAIFIKIQNRAKKT